MPKKWKEISDDDFSYKTNDTAINAVILQESANYYFDVWREELRMFIEINRRILILDDNAINYATIKIPYKGYDFFEEFVQISGFTYNLENQAIKKTKLKNKNIKTIEINKYDYEKILEFQKVKKGSIIDLKYTIASLEIVEPRKWHFQHEIPVLYSSFTTNLPDFISYRLNLSETDNSTMIEKQEAVMSINYIFHYSDPIPSGSYYRNRSFTTPVNFNFKTWLYQIEMRNIDPITNEDYVDCYCNYQKAVELNLFRIDKKTGLNSNFEIFAWEHLTKRLYQTTDENYEIMTKNESDFNIAPSGFIVFTVNDWESVDKSLNKNENFGLQLIRAIAFKPIFREIDENFDDLDDFNKMIKIYDFVRLNFKWDGNYSIYSSKNLSEVLELKSGNSADLNLLLVNLMQKAELDASPVVLKTLNKGHLDSEFAYAKQFNNVIAIVKLNNKNYFLDASQPNNRWFELNKENLNGKGRIIKKIDSEFIEISNNSENICKTYVNIMIDSNNIVHYTTKIILNGYFVKDYNFDDFVDITKYKNLNIKELTDSLKGFKNYSADFELNQKFDGKQFNPFEIFSQKTTFLNPLREIPVFFDYPYSFEYQIDINYPSNKKISKKPEEITKKINGAELVLNSEETENGIKIIFKYNICKQLFEVSEYEQLREFFFDVDEFYKISLSF